MKFEQLNEHERNVNARHGERILPSCTDTSLLEQQPSVGCLRLESRPNKFDLNRNRSKFKSKTEITLSDEKKKKESLIDGTWI